MEINYDVISAPEHVLLGSPTQSSASAAAKRDRPRPKPGLSLLAARREVLAGHGLETLAWLAVGASALALLAISLAA
jgi:hypothetical protein